MQENEFEKQLRKLMGEFKVSPSAPVWERIKRGIEERRRRWPLVALLLSAVLITAGYMMYEGWNSKEIKTDVTAANRDTLQKVHSPLQQQEISKQADSDSNEKNAQQKTIATNKSLKAIGEAFEKNKNLPLVAEPAEKSFIDTSAIAAPKNESGNNDKKEITQNVIVIPADSSVNKNKINFNNVTADKTNKPTIKADTAKQQDVVNDKAKSNTLIAAKKSTAKKPAEHNLSFGILVYGGRSNTVDNLYNSSKSASGSTNITTGPGTNAIVRPQQPFTPSYSYSIGGFAQKNMSKKLSVSAGLNYTYFKTEAQTTNITSAITLAVPGLTSTEFINSYYRPGNNQLQVNNYKFIGASMALHQNIISSKKIPVYADAGISAMRLLSSKTLIYDNNSNAYYYKEEWLQKTQAAMQLGVSMHIKLNSNNYIILGPEAQYGFTNLLKNKNYTPQHLFSYGVHAGWTIGKK